MLETASVREIVFGRDGVANAVRADMLVVNHGAPIHRATCEMAAELEGRCEMQWIDAPVSGGPEAADGFCRTPRTSG